MYIAIYALNTTHTYILFYAFNLYLEINIEFVFIFMNVVEMKTVLK